MNRFVYSVSRLKHCSQMMSLSLGALLCAAGHTPIATAQVTLPAVGDINTVAGNGSSTYSVTGGSATSSGLPLPRQIAVDSNGNIYVSEVDTTGKPARRIVEISAASGDATTVSALSEVGPQALAVDSKNNLYVADSATTVQMLNISTGAVSTVAGNGTPGCTGNNVPATSAELGGVSDLAIDSAGNIYIADNGCSVIRKVTASTGIMTTIAGTGTQGYSGDNGPATSAELDDPSSIAVDASGNIYVTDTRSNRIRKIAYSTGVITTIVGTGAQGFAGDNGPAVNAQMYSPTGVRVDGAGNLYIVDAGNNRVRVVTASTGYINTIAGDGNGGYSGDNGSATSAGLTPETLALGAVSDVYVADYSNNRVRAIGTPPLTTSILAPEYEVTSILYAAPGNKSSAGFSNTTTNGTTSTFGNSFANATTISFTEGLMAFGAGGSASQSFGVSESSSNSNAFTETFSDATSASNQSNSNNSNAINHNNDLFLIWLNPQVSVQLQGSTPVSYALGVPGSVLPDILEIFAVNMEANAAGVTTVPATFLNQQTDPATGTLTPGLAKFCANLITSEYAAGTCTLADQCGCTPSDFAPILALDPLLNYPGNESPLNANVSSSGDCGALPTPSGNCRYVPVPASKGSSIQALQTLAGPANTGGNSNCNSFTQTDSTTTTQTLAGTTSESVGASFKAGSPTFSLTVANTLTWTQSQGTGTSSGNGNSQSVTLCSATVGCGEDVSVYEDTVYHTFVFQQPTGNNSCP